MIGEAEVVVGAEIQHRSAAGDGNHRLLRTGDDALMLVKAGVFDLFDLRTQMRLKVAVHACSSERWPYSYRILVRLRTTLPVWPEIMASKPCWKSSKAKRCVMTGEISRPESIMTDILYQVSYISRP